MPGWCTPDIVIFDEDIEEKIDDFPEFTDSQKQIIRHAMHGSPHAVRITNHKRNRNRFYSETITDSFTGVNVQIQYSNNTRSYPHTAMGADSLVKRRGNQFLYEPVD